MNTIENKFPRSLLQNSVEVRKSYFNNRTISHPRLEAAKEHVLSLIDNTGEPDVLIVTGPTGIYGGFMRLMNRALHKNSFLKSTSMWSNQSHLFIR